MNYIVLFWTAFAFVLLFSELAHPGLFYFVSFSLGALTTAVIAAWCSICFNVQLAVFVAVSVGIFFILRVMVSFSTPTGPNYATNTQALIGKKAFVIVALSPEKKGVIKLAGQEWAARDARDRALPVGTRVRVVEIVGCHAVVTPDDVVL